MGGSYKSRFGCACASHCVLPRESSLNWEGSEGFPQLRRLFGAVVGGKSCQTWKWFRLDVWTLSISLDFPQKIMDNTGSLHTTSRCTSMTHLHILHSADRMKAFSATAQARKRWLLKTECSLGRMRPQNGLMRFFCSGKTETSDDYSEWVTCGQVSVAQKTLNLIVLKRLWIILLY